MLGGFKVLPDPNEIFKRKSYNKKRSMIIMIPFVLLMYAFWYLVVIPKRKISEMFSKK